MKLNTKKQETKYCICGCETLISKYNKNGELYYAKGHCRRGKKLSDESKKKISVSNKGKLGLKGKDNPMWGMSGNKNPMWGKKHSEETKRKISQANKYKHTNVNEKNPQWKGINANYSSIHEWVRRNKPKPKNCTECSKETTKLDAANISKKYKRDLEDYIYLCRSCHAKRDSWGNKLKKEGV